MNALETALLVFALFWVLIWIVWTLGNFARNKLTGN